MLFWLGAHVHPSKLKAPVSIELPARLLEKLQEQRAVSIHYGWVIQALQSYEQWLTSSRASMSFFPDFTDHGPNHLSAVLSLCDFLISDGSYGRPNAWEELTPADSAAVILATLAHDAGMHLSDDGFLALIAPDLQGIKIPGFDSQTWSMLWEQFLEDAHRWDGRTRKDIFGSALSVSSGRPEIRRPPDNSSEWDELDRRLIGEFVRRHHPRLAHEIAISGYPTTTERESAAERLQFAADEPHFADLVGLIARSHGMSLRDVLPYLEQLHFSVLESRGVHPVFLMGLLRIADYLHLHAERAPTLHLTIQKLRSPISSREWAAHRAIYDIRLDTETDPEAIAIDVSPTQLAHVSTFLRIRGWVSGIQAELDQTWAVLGEVYGRHERLRNLWLSVRRIHSNIERPSFQDALPFRPVHAAFEAADADLLKLLIKPLYGDDPGIGLRELIQNATDAVRELAVYNRQMGTDSRTLVLHPDHPDADVLVCVRKRTDKDPSDKFLEVPKHWKQWIEIRDRGIGMSADTVKNYFLRAGASFRYSDAWRKMFERDPSEDVELPRSKVLRSGRFGIGALAAFLLGDEIQVSTKYVGDHAANGIAFTAELETRDIQLTRIERLTGTTVRIRVDDRATIDSAWEYRLDYDKWYCLAQPVVVQLNSNGWRSRQSFRVPGAGEEMPAGWHRIAVPGYQDVQWTYRYGPHLTCNGIRIKSEDGDHVWTSDRTSLHGRSVPPVSVPNLSVFDPDGRLPLNLARTGLATRQYPFERELLEDVLRDYIAFALVHAPAKPLVGSHGPLYSRVAYPGSTDALIGRRPNAGVNWVALKQGTTIPDISLVTAAGVRRMLVLVRKRKARWVPSFDHSLTDAIFGFNTDMKSQNFFSKVWPLREMAFHPYEGNPLYFLPVVGARAVLPKRAADTMLMTEDVEDGKDPRVSVEAEHGKFVLWQTGSVPPGDTILKHLMHRQSVQRHEKDAAGLIEWYLHEGPSSREPSTLSSLWMEIVGQPCIPYDPAQREVELRPAFDELRDYVRAWQTMRYEDPVSWRYQDRRSRYLSEDEGAEEEADYEDYEYEDDED